MWEVLGSEHYLQHERTAYQLDVKTKKNVKWVAQLGSQSYGNVVVSANGVYRTNNEGLRDPKVTGTRCADAFRESDGEFMCRCP